uniref:Adenosine deaminase domain-containing protein n=1 Tax=Glossina pallidipes TaxID=7398 RepID=A0A1B0A4N1_GLOPL
MENFLQNLPKIELHAHLHGSLCITSIRELGLLLHGDKTPKFLELSKKLIGFDKTDNLKKCFHRFTFMHELTASSKGLELATELVIRDFARDNVIYLELRSTPRPFADMSRRDYLKVLVETIESAQKAHNIVVKLLISIDRSQPVEVAEEIVTLAEEIKKEYPNIVKGLDLSGDPFQGTFQSLQPLLKKAKDAHLSLALHCAEIDTAKETQEMLDFGFQRCGHGTFLKEEQLQQCVKQNITIECCLTSNVKCGTVKSYDSHHFPNIFRNTQCRVVLCSDDCGIFDSTLTQEFLKGHEFYQLSKDDIQRLSMNAIEASFADDQEKTSIKQTVYWALTDCFSKLALSLAPINAKTFLNCSKTPPPSNAFSQLIPVYLKSMLLV